MGLKITSIARLPENSERDFYIYFLDYGWDEPLTRAMYDNFDKLAGIAAENRSLVIAGLNRTEFANEVLSWHQINREEVHDILPAIMITDCNPKSLAETNNVYGGSVRGPGSIEPEQFILLPLRNLCSSPNEVVQLLEKIGEDISKGVKLADFEVSRVVDASNRGLSKMLILQPNIAGVGVDLKEVLKIGTDAFNRNFGKK